MLYSFYVTHDIKIYRWYKFFQDWTCLSFCPECLDCITDHKHRRLKLQLLQHDCEVLILLLIIFALQLHSEFPNTLQSSSFSCFLPLFSSVLPMGTSKSKPKDSGQRSLSLDCTINMGSSSGHHFNSGPQTQTPNQSPAVGTSRRSNTYHTNGAEHQLFGGADHMASIASPIRGIACD